MTAMETFENSYCRFCAEPKSSEKLLNLLNDSEKLNEVMLKLAFVNAVYVDVSRDSLPKAVCFVCYDSLNKAYDFLDSVKRAQEVLTNLFSSNETNRCYLSDNDIDDDYFCPDGDNGDIAAPEVKSEKILGNLNLHVELTGVSLDVKTEPKEEKDNDDLQCNVEDILGVAMRNPLTSSMTIYAKEMPDVSRKSVKNWSQYPWVCSYCSIEFITIDMLRSHAKLVHGKCAAYYCIDCKMARDVGFVAFVKHVRKHRKSLRQYCYYCDDKIESTCLKSHIKNHFKKPCVPCHLCGEILKNEDMLKVHMLDYGTAKPKRRPRRKPGTPITVEDLTCHMCKKVYKNLNSLRDHMKRHTSDRKKDYTCDRCGKMFYNKGTLTSHIMAHDKIRPHVCMICNRSFLFPNMLRRHVLMHSGVKPFSCEQCGRCFRLQYQLKAHKIIHTDAMPYVCKYCNKAFRFKQILTNHERQHTGAKPYSCQDCGMEFTNWSNYNKHMKRRHNTDTSKKKITPDGVFPIDPETGQIMQVEDPEGTEEWKSKIMVPGKRGKKKNISVESTVKKLDMDLVAIA